MREKRVVGVGSQSHFRHNDCVALIGGVNAAKSDKSLSQAEAKNDCVCVRLSVRV